MALLLGAVAVLTLAAFFGRTALRAQRSARVAQAGESAFLTTSMMEYGLWLFRPFAKLATRLNVSPDLLSWASLFFHFAAALALSRGAFAPAAWLLLLGGACDSLDGTVARALGKASDAGEVLDAVIDRWAEMAVLFGLAYHYRDWAAAYGACLLAAAGSVMVSYTRAKAQAMRLPSAGGPMQRHERAAYLTVAVLVSALLQRWSSPYQEWPTLAAVGLIAIVATGASLRRTADMRKALRDAQSQANH